MERAHHGREPINWAKHQGAFSACLPPHPPPPPVVLTMFVLMRGCVPLIAASASPHLSPHMVAWRHPNRSAFCAYAHSLSLVSRAIRPEQVCFEDGSPLPLGGALRGSGQLQGAVLVSQVGAKSAKGNPK